MALDRGSQPLESGVLMVMIGVDSHKQSHTFVVVDDVGRQLGSKTFATTSAAHFEAIKWAAQWPDAAFALEDCRHLTRRLERDLLAAGKRAIRVPTRLMAGARRAARQPGKSDPIDVEAVCYCGASPSWPAGR